jgi:hypothetical protein
MFQAHLIVVAKHHQRPRCDPREVVSGQRRLVQVHLRELLNNDREMVETVG